MKNIKPGEIKTLNLEENETGIFIVDELDGRFSAFKIVRTSLDELVIGWFIYTPGQILFECHGSFSGLKEERRTYREVVNLISDLNLIPEVKNQYNKV